MLGLFLLVEHLSPHIEVVISHIDLQIQVFLFVSLLKHLFVIAVRIKSVVIANENTICQTAIFLSAEVKHCVVDGIKTLVSLFTFIKI